MDAKCFSLAVQVWPYLWHCCLPLRKTRLLRLVWSACLVQVDILADHWTHRQTMTWQSPLQLTRRQIKAFIFPRTSGRESCDDKFHQFLIGSYATQLLGPFHQCGEQATITPWVLKSTTKFLKLELGWHLIVFKSNETQPWSLVTNWLTSV